MKVQNKSRSLLGKWDLPLFLGILAAVLLFFLLPKEAGATAVITKDGQVVETIDLTAVLEPYPIAIDGEVPVVIRVEPGCVFFQESACPDQVCVRTGKLSKSGQAAVCLPAKIAIQVKGSEKEIDGYTG